MASRRPMPRKALQASRSAVRSAGGRSRRWRRWTAKVRLTGGGRGALGGGHGGGGCIRTRCRYWWRSVGPRWPPRRAGFVPRSPEMGGQACRPATPRDGCRPPPLAPCPYGRVVPRSAAVPPRAVPPPSGPSRPDMPPSFGPPLPSGGGATGAGGKPREAAGAAGAGACTWAACPGRCLNFAS